LPCTRSTASKCCFRSAKRLLRGGEIAHLGFGDERTDPVDPLAALEGASDGSDHVVDAAERHRAGIDRLAAGRFLAKLRDVHVAEVGEHQRTRDGRRGEHQHIDRLALAREREALVHAEAMLLVDDGEREIAERDFLLEQRVGADQQVELSGFEPRQDVGSRRTALAAGEDRDAQAGRLGERRDGFEMLARQDFRRRHEGSLPASLDHRRGGEQCHDGLAGADIALQQAQHALRFREVAVDLFDCARLRRRERVGQSRDDFLRAFPIPRARPPGEAFLTGTHQCERELAGEQFVIGKPGPSGCFGRDRAGIGRVMQFRQRRAEHRPRLLP
jgi:hypothetical protein